MFFHPVSKIKIKELEKDNAIFHKHIIKDSQPLQLDTTKTSCNIRSLFWPGYFASHIRGTNVYCNI